MVKPPGKIPTTAPDKMNTPKERIDDQGDWMIVSSVVAVVALVVTVVLSVLAVVFFRKW